MQAALKIKDIDAIYLYPYYSMWVDLEKARIEKAKLNFSADINGLNNNVNVECHLELTDMVRKPLEPGQRRKPRLRNSLIPPPCASKLPGHGTDGIGVIAEIDGP